MNKVFLSGNLTRDVEVRYTQNGRAYTRMGIAINRRFKEKESVDFFNLVAWEKTAEFCGKYLRKGSRVLVEGRLQTSSYENKSGVKVNSVEIMVDNIEFASSKRQEDSGFDSSFDRPSVNRESDSYEARNPNPPKKNDDYFGGGEPIDPDDTPF